VGTRANRDAAVTTQARESQDRRTFAIPPIQVDLCFGVFERVELLGQFRKKCNQEIAWSSHKAAPDSALFQAPFGLSANNQVNARSCMIC
jgi:hypothetical protein